MEAGPVRPEDTNAPPPTTADQGTLTTQAQATAEIGATTPNLPAVQEDSEGAIKGTIVSTMSSKGSTSSGGVKSKLVRLNQRRQG